MHLPRIPRRSRPHSLIPRAQAVTSKTGELAALRILRDRTVEYFEVRDAFKAHRVIENDHQSLLEERRLIEQTMHMVDRLRDARAATHPIQERDADG